MCESFEDVVLKVIKKVAVRVPDEHEVVVRLCLVVNSGTSNQNLRFFSTALECVMIYQLMRSYCFIQVH